MISISQRRRRGTTSFAREKFGLTQQQFADALGVSRSLVAMVETGKRNLPPSVKHVYNEMSRSAAELPPSSTIAIRRGRKPAGGIPNLFAIPVVTNYRSVLADKQQSLDNQLSPLASAGKALEKLNDDQQYELFISKLKLRKELLSYHYKGLEFKRKGMEEKGAYLSGKLLLVNALLNALKPLEDKLPAGRTKDKIVLQNAFNNYQQVKLSQQLKKYDGMAILKTELQMNTIIGHIAVADEFIERLSNKYD